MCHSAYAVVKFFISLGSHYNSFLVSRKKNGLGCMTFDAWKIISEERVNWKPENMENVEGHGQ